MSEVPKQMEPEVVEPLSHVAPDADADVVELAHPVDEQAVEDPTPEEESQTPEGADPLPEAEDAEAEDLEPEESEVAELAAEETEAAEPEPEAETPSEEPEVAEGAAEPEEQLQTTELADGEPESDEALSTEPEAEAEPADEPEAEAEPTDEPEAEPEVLSTEPEAEAEPTGEPEAEPEPSTEEEPEIVSEEEAAPAEPAAEQITAIVPVATKPRSRALALLPRAGALIRHKPNWRNMLRRIPSPRAKAKARQKIDWHGILRRALVFVAVAAVSVVVSHRIVFAVGEAIGGFSDGTMVNRFWFVHAFASLFLGGVFWFNRDWFESKPHNLYLVVVLVVTLVFSFGISVRTVGWDIGVHMRNIITFADWEGDIERSSADVKLIEVRHMVLKDEGLLKTIEATEKELDADARHLEEVAKRKNSPLWYVTSVEYLPYALVLQLCRALGVGYAAALVVVRMVGGLVYSLVTYAGMRKLRSGKMLYAVVALIPTSVFLASEFGYSYWLLSFVLYGLATLAGMMQGSVEVRPRTLVTMLAALFVGMLPRVVYFPLTFLCLLIPVERFSKPRDAYVYRGLLVGAALVALGTWLVPRLIAGFGTGDTRGGGGVDPTAQIAYILSHPVEYAGALMRLLLPPFAMQGGGPDLEGMNPVSGLLTFEALPGLLANYGYLSRPHVAYSVAVGIALLVTTLFDKDPDNRTGWPAGVVAAVLAFVIVAMTATALYIDFTPVGLDQIQGVQRRYMLPLVYPLLLFVGPALRMRVRRGTFNAVILCTMAVVLLDSWWVSALASMV